MGRYLVEMYAPAGGADGFEAVAARIRDSSNGVRHLLSLYIPVDETALHLVEADAPAAVERLLRDAGVEADRIVETTQG